MDYLRILATILSVASSVKPDMKGVCVFPGFVQSSAQHPWVMPLQDDERYKAHFSGSSMIGMVKTISKTVSYERNCEDRFEENKYLVSHREPHKPIKYLCMQFIKRSDSIIQLKTSNYSTFMRAYICHDQNLVLDYRPLVSVKHYFHHKVHCPFQAGYNFTVFGPTGESLCHQVLLPFRLESECERGEGMTFKFRNDHCVQPDWGINPKLENVRCLARWEDGGNTFVVLRKINKFRVWCVRITKDINGRRSMIIFFDFICDPGEEISMTDNFIRLEMAKQIFSSTCEDESSHCTRDGGLCDSKLGYHCPKKCDRCSYVEDFNKCNFLDTIRGDWLQLSSDGSRRVNIKTSDMKVQGVGNFQCIKLQAQEFLRREVLLQIFDNGCHPRYTCVDFDRVEPSVLRYRLGHSVEWPLFHIDHKKQYICGNKRFFGVHHEHKPHMTSSTVPLVSLINRKKVRFVNCNFPRNIPEVVGFVDSQWCGGCLSHNRYFSSHRFSVSYANCTNYAPKVEYQCLASMKFKEYKGIITKTVGSKEYLCWIFSNDNRIFNVLGSDCNYVTAENLHLELEKPLAEWTIRQNASFCGPDGPINTEPEMTLPFPTKKAPPTEIVIDTESPIAAPSGETKSGCEIAVMSYSAVMLLTLASLLTLKCS